jgi:hypothetical protein
MSRKFNPVVDLQGPFLTVSKRPYTEPPAPAYGHFVRRTAYGRTPLLYYLPHPKVRGAGARDARKLAMQLMAIRRDPKVRM